MGSLTPNLIDGLAQMQPGAVTLKKEVDKLSGFWALGSGLSFAAHYCLATDQQLSGRGDFAPSPLLLPGDIFSCHS